MYRLRSTARIQIDILYSGFDLEIQPANFQKLDN
jgi:hypothetical protein